MVLPGRAAHAEQLRGGPLRRADEPEVLVAVLVELAAAHDDVPPARPHHVEHRPVRVPTGDDLLRRGHADGQDVLDEQRLAVGDDELGRERRLGEAAADGRHVADGVGENFAVAAEDLGERDLAHLGTRRWALADLAHRTAAWYSASVTSM